MAQTVDQRDSDPRASAIIPTGNISRTLIHRISRKINKIKRERSSDSLGANLLASVEPDVLAEAENYEEDEFITKKEPYAPEGLRGWIIVVAAFCTNFVVDGISISYSVMTEVITQAKENQTDEAGNPVNSEGFISMTEFKTVGNVLQTVTWMMGPVASVIAENIGFRRTAMFGSVIATIGVFLALVCLSKQPNFYAFMFGFGVIGGIGFGLVLTPSIVIVGLHFSKNRALATGITSAGTVVGTFVMAPVINVVSHAWGWKRAMLFQTVLCAVSTLFGIAYSEVPEQEVRVRKSDVTRTRRMPVNQQLRELLRSPSFLVCSFSGSLVMTGYFAPFGLLRESAMEYIPEQDAVLLLSILGITNAVGRVFFGLLASKIGNPLHISNVALTAGGLVTAFYPFANTHAWLIVCAVVFGMYSAVYASLRSSVIMKIVREEKFNIAFGVSLTFMGIAALASNTLDGYLKDATGSYDMSFYVAGGLLIASAAICYPLPWIVSWEKSRNGRRSQSGDNFRTKLLPQRHKSLDAIHIMISQFQSIHDNEY